MEMLNRYVYPSQEDVDRAIDAFLVEDMRT